MKTYLVLILVLLWTMLPPTEAKQAGPANGCGECHACSTPTENDPCLRGCPRPRTTQKELGMGPDEIVINEIESEYEPVHFAHRLHAGMTAMDRGCQDCHHFQEVGGITACKNCHPADAADENLEQPSLKGAYHRQCLGCHQDWSHDTACEICHVKKGQEPTMSRMSQSPGSKLAGLVEPEKKVWNSTYGGGTVVTLFHRNHTEKYGVSCASCHHAEGCAVCHAKEQKTAEIRHSEEALHSICNTCHAEMSCDQCHLKQEAQAFSHSRTGWPLKSYHERLSCRRCHGSPTHFTKPASGECSTCHKPWDPKTFKHEHTGLALSETHADTDCAECHVGGNYAVAPTCNSCHDEDTAFPAALPGKKLK